MGRENQLLDRKSDIVPRQTQHDAHFTSMLALVLSFSHVGIASNEFQIHVVNLTKNHPQCDRNWVVQTMPFDLSHWVYHIGLQYYRQWRIHHFVR